MEKDHYFYMRIQANKHGNWGWVSLNEFNIKKQPRNKIKADAILYWNDNASREKCETLVRQFNILSGHGGYTG
jgi:hypothetical protein